jgi:hypothetical protein
MPKAATALKVFYQNLIHFTSVAHGLQRVVEEVTSPMLTNLFHQQKKVFVKAPQRVQCYRNQLPDVTLPPEQVLTRWGTWKQAVNFYNKHFDVVKSVVATFHAESAIAGHESQTAFSEREIACSVAYVRSNFGWIPDSIKKLETTGLSVQESMGILENAEVKLNAPR